MTDYNLYEQDNYSVIIDPGATYQIDPRLRENIENHLGKIEYSQERIENKGFYAVVKDKMGYYDSLRIENEPEGQRIYVKSGFPDHEQALGFVKGMHDQEYYEYQLRLNRTNEFIEEPELPEHNTISDLKVIQGNNSKFYVGRLQFDRDYEQWQPYTKVSNYMDTKQEAELVLKKSLEFLNDIDGIPKGNLKVIGESLAERAGEDPYNQLKSNLVTEKLTLDNLELPKITKGIER